MTHTPTPSLPPEKGKPPLTQSLPSKSIPPAGRWFAYVTADPFWLLARGIAAVVEGIITGWARARDKLRRKKKGPAKGVGGPSQGDD